MSPTQGAFASKMVEGCEVLIALVLDPDFELGDENVQRETTKSLWSKVPLDLHIRESFNCPQKQDSLTRQGRATVRKAKGVARQVSTSV